MQFVDHTTTDRKNSFFSHYIALVAQKIVRFITRARSEKSFIQDKYSGSDLADCRILGGNFVQSTTSEI
jgi:hypothetical protein